MKKLTFLVPLLFVLGILFGESAGQDNKELLLQRGDSRRATAQLHQPTAGSTLPEAATTGETASAEYPFLIWNTFLGSDAIDEGLAIDVDTHGNIYVTGTSGASWGDPRRPYSGGTDAFVAKLDANGALLWNVFLGGGGSDSGKSITTDENGNVYLIGSSNAGWGIPKLPYTGNFDAFVAKVDSNGMLLWNSFLGGGSVDLGYDVAVDKKNNIFVIGISESAWGSPLRPYGGKRDAFVARLSAGGNLVWNTFFYGPGYDKGSNIAIDPQGNILVIGDYQWASGSQHVFHVRLNPGGAILLDNFSKILWYNDRTQFGLTIDRDGTTYLVRNYYGYDNVIDPYAYTFDKIGNKTWCASLEAGWFPGDEESTEGFDLDIDGNGHVFVTGRSEFGCGWPSLNSLHDNYDALLSLVAPLAKTPTDGNCSIPVWHMFLGGNGDDQGLGIAWHDGHVYIVGHSTNSWGSPNLPFHGVMKDAFVAKLKPEIIIPEIRIIGPLTVCRPPQEVHLDGSGSKSGNGEISRYFWGLQPPAGSAARLSASDQPHARFTADIPGDYIVSLKVQDNLHTWSPAVYHTVRATMGDPPGLALQGERKSAQAWSIRRNYAELALTITPDPSCLMTIPGYRLQRRAGQGAWLTLKDLPESDFRESNGVRALSLTDKYLEPGTAYTYRLSALDGDGTEVAATEITL